MNRDPDQSTAITRDIEKIDRLLAYIPLIEEARKNGDVVEFVGGDRKDGVITMPYPKYSAPIRALMTLLNNDGWTGEPSYCPDITGELIDDNEAVEYASFTQVKAMLTYCIRGERFVDGFTGRMIEEGKLTAVLERLKALRQTIID